MSCVGVTVWGFSVTETKTVAIIFTRRRIPPGFHIFRVMHLELMISTRLLCVFWIACYITHRPALDFVQLLILCKKGLVAAQVPVRH